MDFSKPIFSELNLLEDEVTAAAGVSLHLLREDIIHPLVPGNKIRKLKHNILRVLSEGLNGVVTYGGPHSNHIAATASACSLVDVPCKGFIRQGYGQLLDTPAMDVANIFGMEITMLSNEEFTAQKTQSGIDQDGFLHIPEGGANDLGVKGCEEILSSIPSETDVIAVACGTGSTLAGLVRASLPTQQIIGVNVLKAPGMMEKEVSKWTDKTNYQVLESYHMGGYAKIQEELFTFINWFHATHAIRLDMIYTGKMMFALYDIMKQGKLKKTKIVAVHTGGVQGNEGMEKRYGIKLFD